MVDFPIYFHVRYDTEMNKNGKPEIVCKDVSDHDFVEVVRCKDCKYYKEGKLLAPTKFCYFYQIGTGLNTADDDFCSKGERMEDKNDQRGEKKND